MFEKVDPLKFVVSFTDFSANETKKEKRSDCLHSTNSKSSHTHKIQFEPRYIFKNKTSIDLFLRQYGTNSEFLLKKKEQIDLSEFEEEKGLPLIQITNRRKSFSWSHAFKLEFGSIHLLKIQKKSTLKKKWMIAKITVDYDEKSNFQTFPCPIVITLVDIEAPFIICNYTRHSINFFGRDSKKEMLCIKCNQEQRKHSFQLITNNL